ncbi:DUF4371 domain-containing protein [Trichonephila clavipes]|nr:DUF4371 domain-containing protein [Trichonephila clavipes]
MFTVSAIVRILNRRSDRIKLATFSTFSSVFDVERRPGRESSSTSCRPSLKQSRIDALKLLRYQVGGLYDALLAVCNNSKIDNSIRVEAFGLLSCVKQFKFLCCIVIWYKVLNCINPISKLLQTEDNDLPSSMEFLKNRKDFFKDLRLDTALNEMVCDAREFPDEIDIPANFELTQPRHRVRRRNVNCNYIRHEKIR